MALTALLHGPHGTGKSTLAGTVPKPALILDAEGGSEYLDGKKVYWTDLSGPPPEVDDETIVIVNVINVLTLEQAWAWLSAGKHPFRSVTLDSLSEMQKRFIDKIAGTTQMQQQQWGELLRVLEKFVRDLKDLKNHPIKPLDAVVVVCGSQKKEGEPVGPQLQGALANSIPFFFDLVGFCELAQNESGELEQRVLILPLNNIIAKDRPKFHLKHGPVLVNPNLAELLAEKSA